MATDEVKVRRTTEEEREQYQREKEFYMLMGEVALMREQLEAMQSRMATFWETTLKEV